MYAHLASFAHKSATKRLDGKHPRKRHNNAAACVDGFRGQPAL
jgi:hypothetical protein